MFPSISSSSSPYSSTSVLQKRRVGCFHFVVVPRRLLHLPDARLDFGNDLPELQKIRTASRRSDMTAESHIGTLTQPQPCRNQIFNWFFCHKLFVPNTAMLPNALSSNSKRRWSTINIFIKPRFMVRLGSISCTKHNCIRCHHCPRCKNGLSISI